MSSLKPGSYKWLYSGDQIFPALLAAIDSAQKTIRFETYTYADDELGRQFREALIKACQRGVSVVCSSIPSAHSHSRPASGTLRCRRWRNPLVQPHPPQALRLSRPPQDVRGDEEIAFVGGFNISNVYQGDGVTRAGTTTLQPARSQVKSSIQTQREAPTRRRAYPL